MKFEIDVRMLQLRPNEWKVGVSFSSDALCPYGVVIVLAVETEIVHPGEMARHRGRLLGEPGDRAAYECRHHHDLEAEPCDVLEFRDCFGGRVHWHARRRRYAIGVLAENIGMIVVESAADSAAQFVILYMGREQTLAGVQDGEIEAHLVETLMQQLRHGGGRAVVGIFGGIRPPYRARNAKFAALFERGVVPAEIEGSIEGRLVALEERPAANVADVVEQRGLEFDYMTVGIDDWMADPGTNFGRADTLPTHVWRISVCDPICRSRVADTNRQGPPRRWLLATQPSGRNNYRPSKPARVLAEFFSGALFGEPE
jgi:hypothetical protein